MKKPQTPFPATGYFGPGYFCDREKELDQLSMAIVSEYSDKSTLGIRVWQMIRSLRPVISYDALSGAPLISIKTIPDESRKSIADLFLILEELAKPVVIPIDEFQQILEYPEKQTDSWLRSMFQKLKNVSLIFSGSQQHLMTDLFANPGRPFFRSTQFMKMGKLPDQIYRDFILYKFRQHSKSISEETATEMLEWTDFHTYYVQLLCNRVFPSTGKQVTSESWKEEAAKILKEQEFVFFGYREMLTKPQWKLLKAIAMTGSVYHPTSSDFMARHYLGSSATLLRSLHSLLRMELIYKENDKDGNVYYGVYDVLFGRWINK